MPKAEAGTAKWLANKMKAKGLQKLRWYCQMCEKQCRDENGFKCHRMSESHQRQMRLFMENPNKFMNEYSSEFERGFMDLMRTKYCRTRVQANQVYQEYISDKEHIHMNGTIWETLGIFVQYLGKIGKCHIEKTDKGWFIEYIDREKINRDKEMAARLKEEMSEEQVKMKNIQAAIEAARESGQSFEAVRSSSALMPESSASLQKLSFSLGGAVKKDEPPKQLGGGNRISSLLKGKQQEPVSKKEKEKKGGMTGMIDLDDEPPHTGAQASAAAASVGGPKRPMSALDRLREEHEAKKRAAAMRQAAEGSASSSSSVQSSVQQQQYKEKPFPVSVSGFASASSASDSASDTGTRGGGTDGPSSYPGWASTGLIVKIIDRNVGGGDYYKKKGVVTETKVGKTGKALVELEMLEGGDALRVEEKMVETVIPSGGGLVRIVGPKGDPLVGRHANLVRLNAAEYCVDVALREEDEEEEMFFEERDQASRKVVKGLQYEDICKVEVVETDD